VSTVGSMSKELLKVIDTLKVIAFLMVGFSILQPIRYHICKFLSRLSVISIVLEMVIASPLLLGSESGFVSSLKSLLLSMIPVVVYLQELISQPGH
jgi:hypothetical protein